MTSSRIPFGRMALLIAAGLVVTVWFVAFQLSQPLSLDHGIFVWAGNVIARGGLMYRDTWDHKGPLPYYFTAGIEVVLGHTKWGLRVFDVTWQIAACAIIYAILRKLGVRFGAAVAAILAYLAWYVALDYADTAQPDGWAGVLIAGCVMLLLVWPNDRLTPWWCGVLIGTCCLIKVTFVPFLLLPALYAPPPRQTRRFLMFMGAIIIGWLVPIVISIVFFAAHGTLRDYYEASIAFNLDVYAATQSYSWPMRIWLVFKRSWLSFRFGIPCVLTTYGIFCLFVRDRRSAFLIAIWLLETLAHVAVQGKIVWFYHWLPVLPALAVSTGIGVDAVFSWWIRYRARRGIHRFATGVATVAVIVSAVAVGGPAMRHAAGWTIHVLHGSADDGFEEDNYGWWGNGGPHSIEAASRYIAHRTTPDQVVLFGSSWALGNYLSNRPSPTRLMETRPYMDERTSPYARKFLQEFLNAITLHPPIYIVEGSPELCRTDSYEARYCIQHFEELRSILRQCYTRETELGAFDIWRRTCGDMISACPAPSPLLRSNLP